MHRIERLSLRARLVAGLLAIAAAGLLVAAIGTYVAQRSFLLDRTDEQLTSEATLNAVDVNLTLQGYPPPGQSKLEARLGIVGRGGGGPFGGFRPPRDGPDGGGPRGPQLPQGTFAQRRDDDDAVIGSIVLQLDNSRAATPKLPATLKLDEPTTVDGSDDVRFRVIARHSPRGPGTMVIALPLDDVDSTLNRLIVIQLLVIAAVLSMIAAGAWFLVRLGLRPLDAIGTKADAIAAGSLSERVEPADEQTEVGRLGLALNSMLGRLETAFAESEASAERLRRFLADASHELRTPLASIRGYAELFRLGAASDPEAVERSMRRIEEEAARMGVLVEDLLALARLDEVTERERVPVELATLAEDAVADTRAAHPEQDVRLTTEDDVPVVQADPDQLRQVLANLLRNAAVHGAPPVEVLVRELDRRAVVEIRDHGPGLPTENPQELFERFWRAEHGRERGRAGAGLGLAIVAGIVEAHGGSVHAGNAEDGGARFVVSLPAAG